MLGRLREWETVPGQRHLLRCGAGVDCVWQVPLITNKTNAGFTSHCESEEMETVERPSMRKSEAVEELRRVSRAAHETVDKAFSHFHLSDRASYGAFLSSHARAVFAAEPYLQKCRDILPVWRPRSELLRADLIAMDMELPQASDVMWPDHPGSAWGVLYVLEGSRLGGRILAGRVGDGLPHAYLSAIHEHGEWVRFLNVLGERMDSGAPEDRQAVMDGAIMAFGLFRDAATRQ